MILQGARYQSDIAKLDVTLGLNINNVTDKQYWANNWFIGDASTVS
jgi:outer membrane receptor protein involved in Fe transport